MRYLVLLLAVASPAWSQDNPATALRAAYERCAFGAVMTIPARGDPPAVLAEQALAACATEEQAISAYMLQFMPPARAAVAVAGLKVRLKKELSNIASGLKQ